MAGSQLQQLFSAADKNATKSKGSMYLSDQRVLPSVGATRKALGKARKAEAARPVNPQRASKSI